MMRRSLLAAMTTTLLLVGCAPASPPTATPATPTSTVAAPSPTSPPPTLGIGAFPDVPTAALPADVGAALQQIVDSAGRTLPGVSATVIQAGRGIWTGVAGTSDGQAPIEPNSQFGIASITKTVIAAEIMQLAEQGKLAISDQVSAHLPAGFQFDTNGATIQNLLSMESGIPDPGLNLTSIRSDPMREWTPEEVLATVPSSRSRPGDHFVYEDANYMLLGLVIEATAGTSVAQALRAGVLADPRVATLVYQPAERPLGPLALPMAVPVARGGGYLPAMAAVSSANGSGCMASDSGALALWGYLLFGGQLLSTESLQAMTDFHPANSTDLYGMGVFDQTGLAQHFTVQTIGNGGWDDFGYSSELAVIPSKGIAIAVLTNTAGNPISLVMPIAQQLASALNP
jgi:D-alanyl-D-alanine carboxypeptidase